MKRVTTKTQTTEVDGAVTSTHREEETTSSGLLEAWGYLVLMFFTFLLFIATYRVVSSINQSTNQEHNHGFQER